MRMPALRPPKHDKRAEPLAGKCDEDAGSELRSRNHWNGEGVTITMHRWRRGPETRHAILSDAQLVRRGKAEESDLASTCRRSNQEKIPPKAIIDDLSARRPRSARRRRRSGLLLRRLNGITAEPRADFYQHDKHWSNRMILATAAGMAASSSGREPDGQGSASFRPRLRHQVQSTLARSRTVTRREGQQPDRPSREPGR